VFLVTVVEGYSRLTVELCIVPLMAVSSWAGLRMKRLGDTFRFEGLDRLDSWYRRRMEQNPEATCRR
jgi:hypothetical protein